MMTKKEFAQCLINKKRKELEIPESVTLEGLKGYAYSSSTIAICLETLGLFNENDTELKAYTAARGGIYMMGTKQSEEHGDLPILTVREIIDLLPDTREPN